MPVGCHVWHICLIDGFERPGLLCMLCWCPHSLQGRCGTGSCSTNHQQLLKAVLCFCFCLHIHDTACMVFMNIYQRTSWLCAADLVESELILNRLQCHPCPAILCLYFHKLKLLLQQALQVARCDMKMGEGAAREDAHSFNTVLDSLQSQAVHIHASSCSRTRCL